MEFKPYNPAEIEPKWQKYWDDNQTFAATNDYSKPKFYGLIEFPYPSGNGLHVGHPRSNTAMDIISRKRRMEGHNVLFPIGWDAFGLPTENFAIKHNIHPAIVTKQNVDHFRMQLKRLGFSFDYSREVDTTDPAYYKWTQWIFLKLFEKGMVFRDKTLVNYCPTCKVVLSNEDSQGAKCPELLLVKDLARGIKAEDHGDAASLCDQLLGKQVQRGHADAAADEQRSVAREGRVISVAKTRQNIDLRADRHLAHFFGALPHDLVDQGQHAVLTVAHRDGAAKELALQLDVDKLSI